MRDHSHHIQVNQKEAIRIILENCRFTPQAETVPVKEAVGRVLAQDVLSQWESPNCLTCRMDSVAVHWADFADGIPDTSNWERGNQWEFANTGVAMPEGFDTAIVVEHVLFSEDDTKVVFTAAPSGQYAGTSAAGSKLKPGDVLAASGTLVTPLLAAHLASGNNTQVRVVRKPKVAFLPTGNELVPAGGEIPIGKNIESNSIMIASKIEQWGGIPVVFDVVPDKKEALEAALRKACAEADIVVLNAGSSKGNDDWGIEVLEETGTIFYHQTNHGPGHHSSFGLLEGTPVVGISGPPGGAAFTTDFYLHPVIMTWLGQEARLKTVRVRLGEELAAAKKPKGMSRPADAAAASKGENRPKEGGEFFGIKQLKLVQAEDGVLEAFSVGSAHPDPLQAESADAYYAMPSGDGQQPPRKGDMIEVELRP